MLLEDGPMSAQPPKAPLCFLDCHAALYLNRNLKKGTSAHPQPFE